MSHKLANKICKKWLFSPICSWRDICIYLGNWAEVTLAKTSGTVKRDRETNKPIAVQRATINYPRNNCGTLFGSNSLLVSEILSH